MSLLNPAPKKCRNCKFAVLKVFDMHDVKQWCALNYFVVTDENFREVVESCTEVQL